MAVKRKRNVPDITCLDEISSILVVRLFALGDIVLTLPVIGLLREVFPESWIGYLCRERFSGALAGETGLDEVIVLRDGPTAWLRTVLDLRRRDISIALDLLSSPRSSVITWLSGAKVRIGFETGRHDWCFDHLLPRSLIGRDGSRKKCYTLDANLEYASMLGVGGQYSCGTEGERNVAGRDTGFPASSGEAEWARRFLEEASGGTGRFFGMVTGATYGSKGWPEDRFIELASRVAKETGMRPLLLYGPGEEEGARRIAEGARGAVFPPPTGIERLGALIARMELLIGVDSGPKHIAVLLGVPTVTLFGPTDPAIWDPMEGIHRVVCNRPDCAEGCRDKDCADNTCMSSITVDDVMAEVNGLRRAGVITGPEAEGG